MLKRMLLTAGIAIAGGSACGGTGAPPAEPAPEVIDIGYGTEIQAESTTRRLKSIPGWQIRNATPLTLSEVLEQRGLGPLERHENIFVDGVRWSAGSVEGLPLEQLTRVDLLEGVWGGMAGSRVLAITTSRR